MIRAYYPKHLGKWDGWEEVLPGRTEQQIRGRANRLGIYSPRALNSPLDRERRSKRQTKQSKIIVNLFKLGMPPSAIDKALLLRDGTSRRAVSDYWLFTDFGIEEVECAEE